MDENSSSQSGLIAAIVFATIVVVGSLSYLGYQKYTELSSANVLSSESTDVDAIMEKLDTLDPAMVQALLEEYRDRVTADYDTLVDDDPVYGDKNASVTLIEFSDYQCPFCQRHYTQTYPQIISSYIDTGKVKHVYRDFPLSFHTDAKRAATAAECAREQGGDEAYFEMHNHIFEGVTGSIPASTLSEYARQDGLDMSTFDTCLASEKYDAEIEADIDAGVRLGINGTPGFVITNGKKSVLLSGAQPFSAFAKIIDKLLK